MSEMMQQLGKAQEEVRRLAAKLDRADAMLGQTGDTEHALKADMKQLRAELETMLQSNEYNAHQKWVRGKEIQRLREENERLTKERDEALKRARRTEEEVRGAWQVLDGGTPITTGLAGEVLKRLRAENERLKKENETYCDVLGVTAMDVGKPEAHGATAAVMLSTSAPCALTEKDRKRLLDRMRAAYQHNVDGMAHALAVAEGELLSEPTNGLDEASEVYDPETDRHVTEPIPRALTEEERSALLGRLARAARKQVHAMMHIDTIIDRTLEVALGHLRPAPRAVTVEEARRRLAQAVFESSDACNLHATPTVLAAFVEALGDWLDVRLPPTDR